MTKKELKQKTTEELQSLQEFNKNKAIELINEGDYVIATQYLNRAEDIDCILEGRKMKKSFKTVEQVAEYLQGECYNPYLDTDYKKELEDIEVNGMKKFLPQDGKYDIHIGFDNVVAIFATEDTIVYIWQSRDINDFEYIVRIVDNEEIAYAISDYPQYVKDGGCLDVSRWLMEAYCDSRLSIDYEVLTTTGRIW